LFGTALFLQGLCIGIANDKVYAFDALLEHVIDGVASAAAYSYYFNHIRLIFW
jgi:hypothetical protein